MRLLNVKTLELEEFDQAVPDYAILSHRWGEGEVSFQHFTTEQATKQKGWQKVFQSCQMTQARGLSYLWIDTCCIDKKSSAELTESINSMYRYYEEARECYAYLADVHASSATSGQDEIFRQMSKSAWFTRGWTLQELIAPSKVIFFNNRWEKLWTKKLHSTALQKITQISWRLLEGEATLSDFSIAQRMAWAANRTTTRPEDEAYCLLGIFQVNMAMLYGEGRNAFRRLQEEIIRQSDDHTLFAWHDERDIKPILAPSVACFKDLHDLKCIYATNDARFGHTLSNSGLNIKLMLIPWAMDTYVAPLSCGRPLTRYQNTQHASLRGYRRMGIFLRRTKYENHLVRVRVKVKQHYTDCIMLDSDVVARKRDAFQIKDRQIFIRQSLVEMPDNLYCSFTFSFNHPRMFRHGYMPASNQEILNNLFKQFANLGDPNYGFILEDYSHYESAVFDISNLYGSAQSHYLRLGYDLDFTPVCLINTELRNDLDGDLGLPDQNDLDGMYRSSDRVRSLPWLLSKIDAGKAAETVLAFRAKAGASTNVHCVKLGLKIQFEVREARQNIVDNARTPPKMWHITFEPGIQVPDSIPPSVSEPKTTVPRKQEISNSMPTSPPKKGNTWMKFVTTGKVKPSKPDRGSIEWKKEVGLPYAGDKDADKVYVREISRVTNAPEVSFRPEYQYQYSTTEFAVVTPGQQYCSEEYPQIHQAAYPGGAQYAAMPNGQYGGYYYPA